MSRTGTGSGEFGSSTLALGERPLTQARRDRVAARRTREWRLLLVGCVAVAAVSLLTPSEPTYDPWAWIIWGREITEGALNTVDGPSWKPLPVLFTTPFALFGDDVAPNLWLVVARAGGLLAVVMAYRLGSRLAGRWAGVIAAVSLLLADDFIRNFLRGNSEGLLVALCLWAVERHLDGHRRDAFLLGFGAALLRPEVWPFFGLYGLWLAWRDPRLRVLVLGCFAATGVLWFLPEWIGSGNPLRAAERARNPNPDSAAFADVPFIEVFVRSGAVLAIPVLAGAVVALVEAWRHRSKAESRVALAFGATAAVLMVAVAAMTQGGFAGNLRYVALPAALVCVLAGAGWVGLVRGARARWGAGGAAAAIVALLAVCVPLSITHITDLGTTAEGVRAEADSYGALPQAIEKAGGRDAMLACGGVYTGPFQVQALAWYMHIHGTQVTIPPDIRPPGTIIAARGRPLARDRRFAPVGAVNAWMVRRTCHR
jgi:hypothetical protein